MVLFGERLEVAHAVTWLWAFFGLAGVFALTRKLGGSRRAGFCAVALLGIFPTFFAQSGLILSDIPATALMTWAWTALLGGARLEFVLINSLAVLCKEQAYALCFPAFALVFMRSRKEGLGLPRALFAAAPLLIPGALIVPWILLARKLTGTVLFQGSIEALGFRWLPAALHHNFVRGGKLGLWLFAAHLLWSERAVRDEGARNRRFTFLAAASLPLVFPAAVTRYMLPSVPLLCALCVIALERASRQLRLFGLAMVSAFFVVAWREPVRVGSGDIDWNMSYRQVLAVQRQAVFAVTAQAPQRVLASFPIYVALTSVEGGFVEKAVPATAIREGMGLKELCAHTLLVDAQPGNPAAPALEPLLRQGLATPWQSFGPPGFRIVLYRIDCGAKNVKTSRAMVLGSSHCG
jgi:hypothetical protein